MNKPAVSVILPVFNAEKYISNSILSILNQSFVNFELILINDGSSDKSLRIMKSFNDSRIVIINNESHSGLVNSLNIGIEKSKANYIARMDADDICHPDRLHMQFNFMQDHSEIGLLGTQIKVMDENLQIELEKVFFPLTNTLIQWELIFKNSFAHPSVMFRKELLKKAGNYDQNFYLAEDYELWTRFKKFTKMANLPDTLLTYRRHDNTVSLKNQIIQENLNKKIQNGYINDLLIQNIFPSKIEFLDYKIEENLNAEQKLLSIDFLLRIYNFFINRLISDFEKDSIQEDTLKRIQKILSLSENKEQSRLRTIKKKLPERSVKIFRWLRQKKLIPICILKQYYKK